MPDPSSERVTCPNCGKGYRWQDALVGRPVPCKQCGEPFEVPASPGVGTTLKPEPASGDSVYALDLGDESHPDQPAAKAAPPRNGKCPSCNSPVKEHAVLCMNCGFNMQEGKKMAAPQVSELPAQERKAVAKQAAAPIQGMMLVRAGLWLYLLSILAVTAMIPLSVGVLFFDEDVIELLTGLLAFGAIGVAFVGALLCLAAPKESGGRPYLIASIFLNITSITIEFMIEFGSMTDKAYLVADLIGIGATAMFLYFFVKLARHLDFPEITERAEKVLGLYLLIMIGAYLLMLPVIGCILVFFIIGGAIYTLWLYVLLLIDLNNALTYHIREQ